jgi:hypothetical protein
VDFDVLVEEHIQIKSLVPNGTDADDVVEMNSHWSAVHTVGAESTAAESPATVRCQPRPAD